MKCSICSTGNPDGTVYCESCGSVLDTTVSIDRASIEAERSEDVREPEPLSSSTEASPEPQSDSTSEMRLRLLRGPNKGKNFPLEEGTNLIGRWDPDTGAFPEVDLEGDDVEAKVSRKHAVIEKRGCSAVLRDVGSLNGTFVNRSDRLDADVSLDLKAGDEVIFGKTFLVFEIGPFDSE